MGRVTSRSVKVSYGSSKDKFISRETGWVIKTGHLGPVLYTQRELLVGPGS